MNPKAYRDLKNAAPVNPDKVYNHSGFNSAAAYRAYKNGGAK